MSYALIEGGNVRLCIWAVLHGLHTRFFTFRKNYQNALNSLAEFGRDFALY
jgi:hypothetical protein